MKRFNDKYRIDPVTGCWLWIGGKFKKGYGAFRYLGKVWRAHRVSYLLHKGPIPEGMDVLHSCDTPECVNPDHLFLGSELDNTEDMYEKNRQSSDLSREDARAILFDERSNRTIAMEHCVNIQVVQRIKRRVSWLKL